MTSSRLLSLALLAALASPAAAQRGCNAGDPFCVQVNVNGRTYLLGPGDILPFLTQAAPQAPVLPQAPLLPQAPAQPPVFTVPPDAVTQPAQGGTVYGIFVGITDYQGENVELPGVADGAQELAQAVVENGLGGNDQVLALTDEDASLSNLRIAFAQLAPRVGPNDTFIFFFGGHGGGGALELIGNDALTPRILDSLLDGVQGHTLVAIDSCESGAFASVVRHQANRNGIFSARANEVSYSGGNAGDGGWVWHCLMGALNGQVTPSQDGWIHDRDLNAYVAEVYRSEPVTAQHAVVISNGNGSLWPGSQLQQS